MLRKGSYRSQSRPSLRTMQKRNDRQSIMIIGAGPIGEARHAVRTVARPQGSERRGIPGLLVIRIPPRLTIRKWRTRSTRASTGAPCALIEKNPERALPTMGADRAHCALAWSRGVWKSISRADRRVARSDRHGEVASVSGMRCVDRARVVDPRSRRMEEALAVQSETAFRR